MIKKWNSLGVQKKLHILIQGTLIILFFISVEWVISRFDTQITASVQARAVETADGLINGMNMLMLTKTISNPDNRQLLLKKMGQSNGVKELRIIRAKQVSDQFGPGLPEEQAVDDIDREVIASGKTVFQKLKAENGAAMLRVVVPFIAQENFRGTNCLTCHHVKSGSVNGAASVVIDLTEEEANITEIKQLLWLGQFVIQVLLSIIIWLFVRILIVKNIAKPVKKLQTAMAEIQRDMDLSRRVDIDVRNADIGEMAKTFNALVGNLQHANERLITLNKELDDFAYIAAHDLKEPLRGIHNYASFLKEDYAGQMDEGAQQYVNNIQRLAERLSSLIDRLLAYSRAGSTELAHTLVDVDTIVDKVAEDLSHLWTKEGIELRRNGRLGTITGDVIRIGEVFQNLISNAAKYNDKPSKWIEVGCDRSSATPVFYIRDNGIGIQPQHHENVFRIFKRLHEQNKYGGGTGAGLTIVKKIIERHGGRIWLESVPDKGTTFYFTLNGEV